MTEETSSLQDQTDSWKSKENPQIKQKSPIAKLSRKHRFGKNAPWKLRRRKKQNKGTPQRLSEDETKQFDERQSTSRMSADDPNHYQQVESKKLEIKSGEDITSKIKDPKKSASIWASKSYTPLTTPAKCQAPLVEVLTPAYWDHRQKSPETLLRISNGTDGNDADDGNQRICSNSASHKTKVFNDKQFSIRSISPICQLNENTEITDDVTLCNLSMATQISLPTTDNLSIYESRDTDCDMALHISRDAEDDCTAHLSHFSAEDEGSSFVIEEDGQITEIEKKNSFQRPRHQILTNTSFEQARADFLASLTSEASKTKSSSYEDILTDYLGTSPIIKEVIWEDSNDCVLETRLRASSSKHSLGQHASLCHLSEEIDDKVKEFKSGKIAELMKKLTITRTFRSPPSKKENSKSVEYQKSEEEIRRDCERVADLVSSLLSIPEHTPSPSLRRLGKKSHNLSVLSDIKENEILEESETSDGIRSKHVDESKEKKKGNKISRFFRRVRKRLKGKK